MFSIEQHGLDPISHAERHGQPRHLLWTWLGGTYNYVVLAAGALPILFGLSLSHTLLAALLGNLLGAIVFGLCAIHGPRTATDTIVNTRASFLGGLMLGMEWAVRAVEATIGGRSGQIVVAAPTTATE